MYTKVNFTLNWTFLHNQRLWWLWQIWNMVRTCEVSFPTLCTVEKPFPQPMVQVPLMVVRLGVKETLVSPICRLANLSITQPGIALKQATFDNIDTVFWTEGTTSAVLMRKRRKNTPLEMQQWLGELRWPDMQQWPEELRWPETP